MNRLRLMLLLILAGLTFLIFGTVSAQQIRPAAGSLDSSEDGLWNYYKGMSRTAVKRNAPLYEKLNDSGDYLLDYKKIRGVELFLTAKFKNNRLNVLQITTPFPEYEKCSKETKDLSKSFAQVAYRLMGIEFRTSKQCRQVPENGGAMVCTADDHACVYRLCPGETWALACTVTE